MCELTSVDITPVGDPEADRNLEMSGIEPETFHMRSERSTTELHPRQYPPNLIENPLDIESFNFKLCKFAIWLETTRTVLGNTCTT